MVPCGVSPGPECQRLFEDFTDQSGRALVNNLVATESPANVLAALYFVDGDDTLRCRGDRIVAAFTTPGSHEIHVCGERFKQFAVSTSTTFAARSIPISDAIVVRALGPARSRAGAPAAEGPRSSRRR